MLFTITDNDQPEENKTGPDGVGSVPEATAPEPVGSTEETKPSLEYASNPPLNPGWLVPITVVAGLAASGPLAGAVLFKCGYRKLGCVLGAALGLVGLAIFGLAIFWSVEWYWATLTLTGVHLLCGALLLFILWKPYRNFCGAHEFPRRERGTYREIAAGMVGGASISVLLGTVGTIVYTLLFDRLFSTLMPVVFEDEFVTIKVVFGVLYVTIAGTIAGGLLGRFQPRITPGRMFLYGLALIWAHHTWLMALECTIAIPGFQAGAATGEGWSALLGPIIFGDLLVGFWWSVFLLFFIISPVGIRGNLGRAVQVVGINLAAGVVLSISFGYPAEMFLALGRHFERQAYTPKALWCYERGLNKEPKEMIASYLQYRVALLNHKLGNQDKAKQGFGRVVAKYTSNEELVRKASRFLDNLERSAGKRRIVLSGVETRTEYQGAYCVPNSLALAMRYWGSDVTARIIGKKITGLGSGTFIVNQTWFAEQEGFRHDFLPMADLNDVKQCIDAGFPVLVYVPAHIFAIVGYDEALETFVTYDVATRDVWVEYIQKDFIKSWKKRTTTLVLAYPPEKEALIPDNIRDRLVRLSDNFLHFQLHFFDAPKGSISTPHLFKAAGETGDFFFPLTILYVDFPGLRNDISERYDTEVVADSIKNYFWDDFDEGIHLWGQYHSERWAWPDWALKFSVEYLIGRQQFDLIEQLVTRIDEEGQVSRAMLADVGMIDLARGDFPRGLDRLKRAGSVAKPLYPGLAMKAGDNKEAIRELLKTVRRGTAILEGPRNERKKYKTSYRGNAGFSDSKIELRLDEYGFPAMAAANRILVKEDDFGESKEKAEDLWEIWVNHFPFDAPVAEALLTLYERRLAKLDREKDAAVYQRLERKSNLTRDRVERYSPARFTDSRSEPHIEE